MSQPGPDTTLLTANQPASDSSQSTEPEFRILFASDGSEDVDAATRFLNCLPLGSRTAVRVLTVVDAMGWPETPGWYLESGRDWARETISRTEAGLTPGGTQLSGAIRFGARGHEIIQAAQEYGADLLVLAAHELTRMEAFWLGSISRSVAKHARCPVLIAREPVNQLRRVVLAVDHSEHSKQAADYLARLPLPAGSEVVVLHVLRPYQPFPGLVPSDPIGFQREVEAVRRKNLAAGHELVEQICTRLQAAGKVASTVVAEGDPPAEVIQLAQNRKADLVVAGARGASLIEGLLVGSVADRLLEKAHCSLLLVR